MDAFSWVLIAVLIIAAIIIAGVAVWMMQRRRGRRLRERFGPEYDRTVSTAGDRHRAENDLLRREKRVKSFHIRSLSSEQRSAFAQAWRRIQASFVDAPAPAIAEADQLVMNVMNARGYPVADFEQRAQDLSVDHPRVVENYRTAHEIALRNGQTDTEELRQAMVHYRALFEDLLEAPAIRSDVVKNYEEVKR